MRFGRMRGAVTGVGAVLVAGVAMAACGGSATSSSTTTTTTKAAPTTTTTTLTPAQSAALQPLLLTGNQFPSGWKEDPASNAASTKNTPACIADLAVVKGSDAHVSAVFLGPGSQPTAAIQTVAEFSPNLATPSAKKLQADFATCDKATLNQNGEKASIAIKALTAVSTGDAGFAAQMTLTGNTVKAYFDVFYAAKGANATFLGWEDTSASTAEFTVMSAKALAKL